MQTYAHRSGLTVDVPPGWSVEDATDTGGAWQLIHERLGAITITVFSGLALSAAPDLVLRFDEGRSLDDEHVTAGTSWTTVFPGGAILVTYFRDRSVVDLDDARAIVESLRASSAIESDELIELVREAIEERTGETAEIEDDALVLAGRLHVQLVSLRARIASDPESETTEVDRFADAVARTYASLDRTFDLEVARDRVYPMLWPAAAAEEHELVARPLIDGIAIVYAIDEDDVRLHYVGRRAADETGISAETLHELAMVNLARLPIALEPYGDGVARAVVHDSFTASRWLLPETCRMACEELGEGALVVLAARDEVWVFARNLEKRARETAVELYARAPHQISDRLLVATPSGLAPLGRKSFWRSLFGG